MVHGFHLYRDNQLRCQLQVLLSDLVWPACLPRPGDAHLTTLGHEVSVVGFGMTNVTTRAKADILQIANIEASRG